MTSRLTLACLLCLISASAVFAAPFEIRVVDDATGRGVPMVELETVNNILYVTDSAGRVAFDELGLMGTKVFFHVRSHGYEYSKDGFGYRGVALEVKSGGKAEIKIKRLNIAERLYRITGQGIYADSLQLGHEAPIKTPAINGLVLGQDSTQAAIYNNKIHWFWGDTNRAAYPLGLFQTSGAVSELPDKGGLAPQVGVNLSYFTNTEGFSRAMAPITGPGVVWIDGLLAAKDKDGRERLVCHFSRRQGLERQIEHGLMLYNDEKNVFERVAEPKLANDETWRHPRGQATVVEEGGGRYWYFHQFFTLTRVRATLEDVLNPAAYEALAPLENDHGRVTLVWRKDANPLNQQAEARLISSGKLAAKDARLQVADVTTGKAVRMHAGAIRWNAFRKCFVMIGGEIGGTSQLGEIWYAEAPQFDGPWNKAVKIITHDKYSFYNPVQHTFFDSNDGRTIYFEGTYTHSFSGNSKQTPRYDYNQIMYKLDLADSRLQPAHLPSK